MMKISIEIIKALLYLGKKSLGKGKKRLKTVEKGRKITWTKLISLMESATNRYPPESRQFCVASFSPILIWPKV